MAFERDPESGTNSNDDVEAFNSNDPAISVRQRLQKMNHLKPDTKSDLELDNVLENLTYKNAVNQDHGEVMVFTTKGGVNIQACDCQVDWDHSLPDESPAKIEAIFECCVLAEATFGKNLYALGDTDQEKLMAIKALELSGAHVMDPDPKGRKLEDVNPALAKQMDEVWAKMKAEGNESAPTMTEQLKQDSSFKATAPGFGQ